MRLSKSRKLAVSAACVIYLAAPAAAQITSGAISGVVQDQVGALLPNATVTLVNDDQGQGSARQVPTNSEGAFVFTPVLPGNYSITVEMMGFKKYTQSGLKVNVNDRIGLPAIVLEVGSTGESITVEANAIQLETVSAERSGVVTGRQMVDIAINGRNFTTLLKTIPGVSADQAGGTATVNGQRGDQNNFTVDGQTVTDIGVNQQFAYRINVDAIAEFKVSTNSQGAEFGRTSGAQIQVVTKSGSQDFHGTGWWFKRGEFMNANSFINNVNGVEKPLYRFMTAGYNLSGPIYIPGKFNTMKDKLFGFMSHEWNRSFTPNPLRRITVPTAAERMGDFTNTRDGAGVVQIIRDPATRSASSPTGNPFPGNMIPSNRFNEHGPSVLNWLPLPNITGQPNFNYQSQAANEDPAYDQVYRVDYNINDKWRLFGRHLNSKQTQVRPYGRADSSNNLGLTGFEAPTYGWSLVLNLATIINPTLTNEFQFGYTVNGIPGNAPPEDSIFYRRNAGVNIPLLYPNADPIGLVPNFNFAGVPSLNGTAMTSFAGLPYANRNPVWNFTDNVTKTSGNHTYKFGFYAEYAVKTENAFRPYNSTINFGRDPNNPGDTNWAFSNALLGSFNNYQQINANPLPSFPYTNFEFYGQDTWKVTSKLTLNYGLRIVFMNPFYDKDNLMANFEYSQYDQSQRVDFFLPSGTGANRRALNPFTGELLPAVYIGAIIPGSGDLNNGMVVSGQNGTPRGLIDNRGAHWAPRLGIAYQIDSNTVFRVGGGAFYERIATFGVGITSNYTTNPPTLRLAELYYGNLSTIATSSAVPNPVGITRLSSDGHVPTTYNYNASIQRQLPGGLFLDVGYVGSQSRHLWQQQPFNNVAFGSAWLPENQDPTAATPRFDGTTTLPSPNMYRPYAGFSNGNDYTWGASSNYNALQVSLQRRTGALQFGVAYTWSKTLGVIQGHLTDARKANYGPLAQDRTQSLSFNYIYDIPSVARRGTAMDNVVLRQVFDGWQLSGLTSISSGAPANVNYNITGVAGGALNRQITGSEDVGPRVVFTCDPNLSRDERSIDRWINTDCFAPAVKGSTQMESGLNRLRGPGLHQWDMNLFKNIPLNERGARIQLRLEAYNAFNTPQWGGFNSTVTFNAQGQAINRPTQLGGTGGRFGFGSLNAIRGNSNRILQIAAKIYF